MKGLKATIQKAEIQESDYREQLNTYLNQYRATPHPATGHSPAELLFNGRTFNTKLPSIRNYNNKKLLYQKEVYENDKKAKKNNKFYYDKRHNVKEKDIQLNDMVLCKQEQT